MRLLCCILLLAAVTISQGHAPTVPSQGRQREILEQATKECTQAKIDLVHAWVEELAEEDIKKLPWSELEHRSHAAGVCSLAILAARERERPGMTTDQESPRILAWLLDAEMVENAVNAEKIRRYQDFLIRRNLLSQFLAEDTAGKK